MTPGFPSIIIIGFFILIAFGLLFWGMTRILATGDSMQERIHAYAIIPEEEPRRGRGRRRALLARLRIRLNAMLTSVSSEKISLQLMQANLRVSVTEFLLIRAWLSLVGLLIGWITSGTMISGVGLAMIAYLIPEIYLRRRISRRLIQFEKQLVDVLVLINGAVRAELASACFKPSRL